MSFSNKALTNFLYETSVTLDNLQKNPAVKSAISGLGFDEARINEGVSLLNRVQEVSRTYLSKRQEKLARSVRKQVMGKIIRKDVTNHFKRLRKELVDDLETATQLRLQGRRDSTNSGFIEQATAFYEKAMDVNAGLLEKITPFGFTRDVLQAGLDDVKRYRALCSEYDRMKGECQRLVEDRKTASVTLRKWMASLVTACRVAFEENPQTLEEIGIFVRNQPKPKKEEPKVVVNSTGIYEHQDIGAAGE